MFVRQSRVLLVISMLLAVTVIVNSKPVTTIRQAQSYLLKFGYLSTRATTYRGTVDANTFKNAVQSFQSFAGLNLTGELDADTMRQMSLPRCGVRDNIRLRNHNRAKRYNVHGSYWISKNLTYNIINYPKGFVKSNVDEEIAGAFAVWSESTDLSFTLKKVGPVHIHIKFVGGEHGDTRSFDGPGGVLAHAFFPAYGGDVHFDTDEMWSIGNTDGISLFQVAAHELGHSLGLAHSNLYSAVMYPYYYEYEPYVKLHRDDLNAIEVLYGKKSQNSLYHDVGLPHLRPDDELCKDPKVDTIFNTTDNQIYAFKGNKCYKLSKTALADGYPKHISEQWPGLPGDIDAAFAHKSGKIYFFKGTQYWRYSGRQMDNNFPREIRKDFIGLPNNLDAAMVWNDNIYFYKGSQFWRFELFLNKPIVKYGYPKSISI